MDVKCNSRTVERVDTKDTTKLGHWVETRSPFSIEVHGEEIEKAVWQRGPEGCEVDAIIV